MGHCNRATRSKLTIYDSSLKIGIVNCVEKVGEASVAAVAKQSVQAALTLQFLLGETTALTQLTQSGLVDAQQQILQLMKLLGSFPALLGHLVPSIHMLAGVHDTKLLSFPCLDRRITYFCSIYLRKMENSTNFVGKSASNATCSKLR